MADYDPVAKVTIVPRGRVRLPPLSRPRSRSDPISPLDFYALKLWEKGALRSSVWVGHSVIV